MCRTVRPWAPPPRSLPSCVSGSLNPEPGSPKPEPTTPDATATPPRPGPPPRPQCRPRAKGGPDDRPVTASVGLRKRAHPPFLNPEVTWPNSVDMYWPLVAEEPHRSPILNLEHCPLKANVSCLIFPLHQGKMSITQPLSGLDSPSQGSRGQLTSTPPYHSPPSLFSFTIGKATRALPDMALFSPYLP
jgi:hypothetical protein